MMSNDQMANKAYDLERVLVKQFRALQKLVEITRVERESLLQGDSDAVLTLVEEKEILLDQLTLVEDERRKLVQEIALGYHVRSESTSLKDILPYLHRSNADQFARLSDGMVALVTQARDLTYGNHALAAARIDWMHSFQTFLVQATMPETGYRPPLAAKVAEAPASSGMEFRA